MTEPQDPKGKAAQRNDDADLSAPKGGRGRDDISEDDLLADFGDILSGSSAGDGAGPAEQPDAAIDELESFLDEFEQHLADGELPDAAAEASAAQPGPAPKAEAAEDEAFEAEEERQAAPVAPASPEIPQEEESPGILADEAVAAAADEPVIDEPQEEPPAVPELPGEELDLADADEAQGTELETEAAEPPVLEEGSDDSEQPLFEPLEEQPLDLGQPSAAADAPEQPAEPIATPLAAAAPTGGGRWINTAAIVLALVGIAGAGGAAWLGFSLSGKIRHMTDQLQLVKSAADAESHDERLKGVMADMDRLNNRLDELAVIIEGPVGHLRESNKRELEALQDRIEKTEGSLNGLRQSLALVEQRMGSGGVRIRPAKKTASGGGQWAVNLASLSDPKMADEELQHLRKQGIPAEKHAVTMGGKTWYRLRVTGFANADEARAYGKTLATKTGFADAWLSHP